MDIAALSVAMSTAKVNDSYSVSILAKTLDQSETHGTTILMDSRYFFARISRVRTRQRQAMCLHIKLAVAGYDEQRE